MHFSSATVLSTLAAAGSVAASNLHHGHAQFHAKRDLEAKRQYEGVDWAKALKDVDWSKVDFGGGKPSSAAAPAANTDAVVAAAAVKTTAAPAPAKTTAAAAKPSTTKAADPAPSASKPSGGLLGGIASALEDLSGWAKLGVSGNSGLNAKAAGSNMWLGSDGKYKATFTNDGDKSVALLCWNAQGMWVNAHKPEIFVNLKGGEAVTVSIPEGKSGGCGAALPDSTLFMGLLNESILEFTAGDNEKGCFDISREINMKGVVMTSKGSRCTSGVVNGDNSCVFVCHAGDSCEAAGSYGIALGSAQEGPCMVGKASDGGSSGGCQFGSNGEHMQVTIASHRNWPAVKGKVA